MLNKLIKYLLSTTVLATALLIVTLISPLNAATLTIDNTYIGWNDPVKLNFYGNRMESKAGENSVYFNSNTSNIAPAYCVDLSHTMFRGENTVDGVVSPTNYSANGIYVEWLMDTYSGTNNKSAATGLQLAIWEVLYDFSISVSGFNLDINNTQTGDFFYYDELPVESWTNGWYNYYITGLLNEFTGGSTYTSSGDYIIAKLSNGNSDTQDLITLNPVPEPSTMLLFGLGLLGMGAIGRKKS